MNSSGQQLPSGVLKLARPPIIEAVIDIACDMPPGFSLAKMEDRARQVFSDRYPKFRAQLIEEHQIQQSTDQPASVTSRLGIEALQFLHGDEHQLVQVRAQGFSFNRLEPYSSLDEYLPEVQRCWNVFVELVAPIQIRKVGLRYINRIVLPIKDRQIELSEYLKIAPRLPDEARLIFTGFFDQHVALEVETGNHVKIILMTQKAEKDRLPIIFDIETFYPGVAEPVNWPYIAERIASLRSLKNRVFSDTLTHKCLNLFQQ